jgi:hypothetical protein
VIKESISNVKYEIQSLVKLFDNKPTSEGERRLFLKYTHDVVTSLQVALCNFVRETDINYIQDLE